MREVADLLVIAADGSRLIEMFFLEHGYGTPSEANALSHQYVGYLESRGHL